MFLNGNAIADKLHNIQLNLTTIRDASLAGIQSYINLIYSSWSIGKLLLISIEKFGFQRKINLYSSRIIGIKLSKISRKKLTNKGF